MIRPYLPIMLVGGYKLRLTGEHGGLLTPKSAPI